MGRSALIFLQSTNNGRTGDPPITPDKAGT